MLPDDVVAALLARHSALVRAFARSAFAKLWKLLADPDLSPREAAALAQVEFGGAFADALAIAFGELLQRSVGVAAVRALPVGSITLARRIYLHNAETAAEVVQVVRQHAAGVHQARELALRLYDGYSPAEGIRRPLEGRARAGLPKALRALTSDAMTRDSLSRLVERGQQQAGRLKSQALRAAYAQAFDAWEAGAGQDALKRRLEVAQAEKNRYFANRISQTELARAHQAQVAADLMADETIEVVQVRINPMHPKADICDLHARADLWGLGPGCYPKDQAPLPPYHPFCMCRVRSMPSLTLAGAGRVPGGEAAYLRGEGLGAAVRIMGSRDRAQAVLDGASVESVINAGKEPLYRLRRLGSAAQHPLVPAAKKAEAVSFVERALRDPRQKQPPLPLAPVSDAAAALADAFGVDLRGKSIALDHDGVIHAMKGHAKATEALRGQAPLTSDDLALFGDIFNAARLRLGNPPRTKDGTPMVEGEVAIGDWLYGFAARVRRRHVVPQTLFKRRHK